MQKRHRFKQSVSLQDRLTLFAKEGRKKAKRLPPSREREQMLRKVRQAEIAAHLDEWVNSSVLRPPR
jgi:hypothetical protein